MEHAQEVKLLVAKKYFKQVRDTTLEITILKERINHLQSLATLTGIDYTKLHVTSKTTNSKIPDILIQLEELNNDYVLQIGHMVSIVKEAEEILNNLDPLMRYILHLYYIDGKTWEQVALKTRYTRRYIQQKAQDGLIALYDFLPEEAKRNLPNASPIFYY